MDLEEQFEKLLWKKVMGRKNSRQEAYYYRKKFRETGEIPEGLKLVEEGIFEGRRAAGRPRAFTDALKAEFCEMVRKSCDDPEHIEFITEPLRKVTNYRDLLVAKYGEDAIPPLHSFYGLCRRERLWRFIDKPDYKDKEGAKGKHFFSQQDVYELVQMDGCKFQTFEIRDDSGKWKAPQVIEIFDTGSRFMFAMDVYWSESNQASVDVFNQWLTGCKFPKRTINFRPDNAGGFRNLERCLTELNRKHSIQGGFWLKPDYARVRKAQDKSHLESSHRALHNFELMILKHFKDAGAFAGVRKKTSFKTRNKIKEITVTMLDINIEDLRGSGLIKKYQDRHNHNYHRFTKGAGVERWRPAEKYAEHMDGLSPDRIISFSDTDAEEILRYGFEKKKATVRPDGTLQVDKKHYYIAGNTDFLNPNVGTPVKISQYKDKLFVFEASSAGAFLAEAVLTHAYDGEGADGNARKEAVEIKKNEFELIVEFLKRQGMTVGDHQRSRLLSMHKDGLRLEDVSAVVELHQEKYGAYRNNAALSNAQVSLVLVNLFFTHAMEYKAGGGDKIAPYAAIR